MHDIKKLPKWAQELLEEKDRQYCLLKDKNERLSVAHSVLVNREWFIVPNPINPNSPESLYLYVLRTNCATAVCALGRGDVLLVGRDKNNAQKIS